MRQLILPLPGNEDFAARLAGEIGAELGAIETRRFPDGESYVRLRSAVAGRDVVLVCTLARPDDQFLRLVFAAREMRAQGALRLTLLAPYLSYMRQDKAFNDGEAVTSQTFASLIAREFDRLITVDPHLHRYASLDEVYPIPTQVLHAGPVLSAWVRENVSSPLVIGPDAESEQWAKAIAAGAPTVVLRKERRGDRTVEVQFPDLAPLSGRQAVLVDDVASSGRTLIQACKGLVERGFAKPVCLVVHGLFAEDSFERLREVSSRIVSTDTIAHASNGLTLVPMIGTALRKLDLPSPH